MAAVRAARPRAFRPAGGVRPRRRREGDPRRDGDGARGGGGGGRRGRSPRPRGGRRRRGGVERNTCAGETLRRVDDARPRRGRRPPSRPAPVIAGGRRDQGPGAHLAAPRVGARRRSADSRALRPRRRREHGRHHRAGHQPGRAAGGAGADVPRDRAQGVRHPVRRAAAPQGRRRGQRRDSRLARGVPGRPSDDRRPGAARAVLRRDDATDGAPGGAPHPNLQAPEQGEGPERGVEPVGGGHGDELRADGVSAVRPTKTRPADGRRGGGRGGGAVDASDAVERVSSRLGEERGEERGTSGVRRRRAERVQQPELAVAERGPRPRRARAADRRAALARVRRGGRRGRGGRRRQRG